MSSLNFCQGIFRVTSFNDPLGVSPFKGEKGEIGTSGVKGKKFEKMKKVAISINAKIWYKSPDRNVYHAIRLLDES